MSTPASIEIAGEIYRMEYNGDPNTVCPLIEGVLKEAADLTTKKLSVERLLPMLAKEEFGGSYSSEEFCEYCYWVAGDDEIRWRVIGDDTVHQW